MKCPVCDSEIKKLDKCKKCGFEDIRTEFINAEELEMWQKYVVYPCRFAYQTAIAHSKELKKIFQKEIRELKNIQKENQDLESDLEQKENGDEKPSFEKMEIEKKDGWDTSGIIAYKNFYECKSYGTRNEVSNIVIDVIGNKAVIHFFVKKTYDKAGETSTYFTAFKWKLKDNCGIVVANGSWSNHNLQVGDVTKDTISISGLDKSIQYVLELVDN